MTPAEQTALRFCSVLFADLGGALDGYFVAVWSSRDKATRWIPASDLESIAAAVREADSAPGAEATYIGMALAPAAGPRHKRMANNLVGALVAVWADIDIASQVHTKPGLPPTEADALSILRATGLAPTMIWRTGHGLQACWVLTEPWTFPPGSPEAARAQDLVRHWNITLAVHAHRLGRFAVDRVHDLARVMRAPGGVNRKLPDDPRRVELIEVNEQARYEVDDLLAHLVDRHHLDEVSGMTARTDGRGAGSVDLPAVWGLVRSTAYRARRYEPEWLTGLVVEGALSETDTLVAVFRQGHSSGDPSSRDASLVRCLADVRVQGDHVFDERDATELIMCARLRDGDKLDKVDPARRTDYVVRTVDRIWGESDKAHAAKVAARATAAAALNAQDTAAERAGAPVPPLGECSTDPSAPATAPRDMGALIIADLAANSRAVTPDPDAPPPTERTGAGPAPPLDGPPRQASGSDDEPAHEAVRALPGPWGTRTESQDRELRALSGTLLGPRADAIQIWRAVYRGNGAKQERRPLLRFADDYRWPGKPPEGYVPGTLYGGGWWPAGTFNTLAGWIKALRQDALIVTAPVSAEEFTARFGDSLVRIWEPDTSGGSLASVTKEALTSYLLDYPPTPEWIEATAQGTPFVMQRQPRWTLGTRFTVLVRWSAFARHVRARCSINVTPAVAAEMAELSGSRVIPTATQDGQWYVVRREYLGDAVWAAVLHGGDLAEKRQGDRHGLYVVGDDRETPPDERRRAAPGATL